MKFLLIRTTNQIEETLKGLVFDILPEYPPLGLLYLGAVLEKEGHEVEIIDYLVDNISDEQLKNYLKSSDAVGMTVYTDNYDSNINIAKKIKNFEPEIPIILGGPHCSFHQEKSLRDVSAADYSVMGDGEEAIVDLVKYFEGKKNLSEINGIFYRDKNQIKKGKPLKIIKDLDSLPFPARHLVEKYEYGKLNQLIAFKQKFTSMTTGRGCPYRCRFCPRYGNIIKEWGFRQRSAENVVKEILEINEKYGSVLIVDDNFLANEKRAHKIMDMLIENKTKIELMIEGARVDSADRKLYKKMKKAHVKFLGYGIETGNQDILDYYEKKVTLDQIKKAVSLGNEMGFITEGTFIIGAPMETEAHIQNTIKFANSLPLDIAHYFVLNYKKGSRMWYEAVRDKKISEDEIVVPADSNRGLANFTYKELINYTYYASQRFYLRPKYILSQLYRAFYRKNFRLITSGFRAITSM